VRERLRSLRLIERLGAHGLEVGEVLSLLLKNPATPVEIRMEARLVRSAARGCSDGLTLRDQPGLGREARAAERLLQDICLRPVARRTGPSSGLVWSGLPQWSDARRIGLAERVGRKEVYARVSGSGNVGIGGFRCVFSLFGLAISDILG